VPPEYAVTVNTAYAEKVLGQLRGAPCSACGERCLGCREGYDLDRSRYLAAVYDFPGRLPYLLDDPESYLPEEVPGHDVLLVMGVHEEVLLAFARRFSRAGGIVVPLEGSDWLSPYIKQCLQELAAERGLELAVPKPFCSFDPGPGLLQRFRRELRIGRPEVRFSVRGGTVRRAEVACSAPCGATYYVARRLLGRAVDDDLVYTLDALLSSYPCTAGTEVDREFGDSIIHRAVQLQRELLRPLKALSGSVSGGRHEP
jgi:hypothetical protein